jgi:hypothetical protein
MCWYVPTRCWLGDNPHSRYVSFLRQLKRMIIIMTMMKLKKIIMTMMIIKMVMMKREDDDDYEEEYEVQKVCERKRERKSTFASPREVTSFQTKTSEFDRSTIASHRSHKSLTNLCHGRLSSKMVFSLVIRDLLLATGGPALMVIVSCDTCMMVANNVLETLSMVW